MSAEIVSLPPPVVVDNINQDAVLLVEGTLERLRNGTVLAVAVVEVAADGVSTHYSKADRYHALNSGAAMLAHRLAGE